MVMLRPNLKITFTEHVPVSLRSKCKEDAKKPRLKTKPAVAQSLKRTES